MKQFNYWTGSEGEESVEDFNASYWGDGGCDGDSFSISQRNRKGYPVDVVLHVGKLGRGGVIL